LALSHVVEVRNETFAVPEFVQLCRKHGVAICVSENENYPIIPDVTGDIVYARLLAGSDDIATCYAPKDLDTWAGRFKAYAEGGAPTDLTPIDAAKPEQKARDVYAFFIQSGKVRAPAGAMALLERL
jgi:uncharacterized protein YecE (DUF72 family)